MNDHSSIGRRKDEHLDIVLRQRQSGGENAFDGLVFEHCALPECALSEIDLSTRFLHWDLGLPFLISSMTGGPTRGERINRHLSAAAEKLRVPFAVGSQRIALEGAGACGLDRRLREIAPHIPLLANFGGAQLAAGYGLAEAERAVDMIGADALIIHLNCLQEAVQSGGDRDWRGVLAAIEKLARALGKPVIVKEVGYGISAAVARRLRDAGVSAVDIAGCGGTAWAAVEAERAPSTDERGIADAFAGWGIPTPLALAEVRAACPRLPLIASGGVRHGVDAAKAFHLGADLVGQAGPLLAAALASEEAVLNHFEILAQQLRIACFCTGSTTLAGLRSVRLLGNALPVRHV